MTTNGRAPAAPSSGDCEGRVRTRVDALSAMQLVVGLSLAAAAAAVLGQPVAFVGDAVPAPLTATPGDPERGRQVVVQREQGHCILCHAVPDPTVRFAGNVGPPLTGVGSRLTGAELRGRIVDPTRHDPATSMPAYFRTEGLNRVAAAYSGRTALTAQQVEDAVAWLSTRR